MSSSERDQVVSASRHHAQLLVPGPFAVSDLDHVRMQVSAQAEAWRLPAHASFALVQISDELITNAIVHGGGCSRLRLSRSGRRVYCQVTDFGEGVPRPHRAGWLPPAAADPYDGRGLWMVRMLCERLTIDSSSIGTTITAGIGVDQ